MTMTPRDGRDGCAYRPPATLRALAVRENADLSDLFGSVLRHEALKSRGEEAE